MSSQDEAILLAAAEYAKEASVMLTLMKSQQVEPSPDIVKILGILELASVHMGMLAARSPIAERQMHRRQLRRVALDFLSDRYDGNYEYMMANADKLNAEFDRQKAAAELAANAKQAEPSRFGSVSKDIDPNLTVRPLTAEDLERMTRK